MEKNSELLVGTVVLRLIRAVMIPPTVSMPSRGKEEQRQEKEDPESSRSCHGENGGLDCDTTGDSLIGMMLLSGSLPSKKSKMWKSTLHGTTHIKFGLTSGKGEANG